jgi:hypothetical protein
MPKKKKSVSDSERLIKLCKALTDDETTEELEGQPDDSLNAPSDVTDAMQTRIALFKFAEFFQFADTELSDLGLPEKNQHPRPIQKPPKLM